MVKNQVGQIRKTRNLKYLRTSNRAEILHQLATAGPTNRMALAGQLGLTKMAISTIIAEMLAAGLVNETSPPAVLAAAGRRPAVLSLVSGRINALGLYLSRDAIEGVLCDISGQPGQTWQIGLADGIGQSEWLARLLELLGTMLDAAGNLPLAGIGISSIGPLDLARGWLLAPPDFHGIHDLPICQIISQASGLPVFLDNDMNAAVLAEQLYGAARNLQHVIYVGISNGIGAGIISYGRVLQGSGGFGGEIGHMSLNPDGPLCSCGNRGCLELYASIPRLLEQSGTASLDELLSQAGSHPGSIDAWRTRLLQVLTATLASLANIFDPEMILLGHQGVRLAPLILPVLEKAMNQIIFQRQAKQIPVRAASFGEKTPLIGAASLVFQAIFRGELPIGPDMPAGII